MVDTKVIFDSMLEVTDKRKNAVIKLQHWLKATSKIELTKLNMLQILIDSQDSELIPYLVECGGLSENDGSLEPDQLTIDILKKQVQEKITLQKLSSSRQFRLLKDLGTLK